MINSLPKYYHPCRLLNVLYFYSFSFYINIFFKLISLMILYFISKLRKTVNVF
jgi:hypothetical protein